MGVFPGFEASIQLRYCEMQIGALHTETKTDLQQCNMYEVRNKRLDARHTYETKRKMHRVSAKLN